MPFSMYNPLQNVNHVTEMIIMFKMSEWFCSIVSLLYCAQMPEHNTSAMCFFFFLQGQGTETPVGAQSGTVGG